MQQATPPMMPVVSPFPSANITTEQIQKCLDENKKLILAILDNQNLGKLAECAQYQAQLQKNLMYLAAIADAQPQIATVPAQMPAHPTVQQGAYYMQQQAPQQGIFPPRMPTQFASPLQLHEHQQQLHQQHQQAIPGQVNFRRTGPSNSMPPMQTGTLGGSTSGRPPAPANASDARGGNKQDDLDSGHATGSVGDGQGSSAAGAGDTKGPEEGN